MENNVNVKERTIRVFGREKTRNDGTKYVEYSFTKDGDTFYRVSFTNDCSIRPTKVGYWLLKIDANTVSLKKAQQKTNKDGVKYMTNPTMFIGNVLAKPVEDTEYAAQVAKMKQDAVDDLLGA